MILRFVLSTDSPGIYMSSYTAGQTKSCLHKTKQPNHPSVYSCR